MLFDIPPAVVLAFFVAVAFAFAFAPLAAFASEMLEIRLPPLGSNPRRQPPILLDRLRLGRLLGRLNWHLCLHLALALALGLRLAS